MSHETMEPDEGLARLTPVTAQNLGTERAHDTHDRLLVARFATGDALAADEAAAVRALLATCSECQSLVADLQVVQHATATSLAPRRPREFFLTPEQAETLRPNAWQRLLGRLSAPRAGALRPLAGATLAIGIVLVGASAVVPKGDTVMVQEPNAQVANGTFVAPEMDNGGGNIAGTSAMGSPAADGRRSDPYAKGSPGPVTLQGVESAGFASPDPRTMMIAPGASTVPDPAATPQTADMRLATAEPGSGIEQSDVAFAATAEQAPQDTTGSALLVLGMLLAFVSILVLVLSWLARRTIDPLLR